MFTLEAIVVVGGLILCAVLIKKKMERNRERQKDRRAMIARVEDYHG